MASKFLLTNKSPVRREIPGIVTGVGASQTAVIKVPYNSTYSCLEIRCTIAGVAATRAELEAMIGEIRVALSGTNVETLSAKQLIAITEFYRTGETGDTGVLVFDFQRLWMLGAAAQQNPAWGTLAETSFEIQIDQVAASTVDLMRVYATFESTASELGNYIRRVRMSPPVTAIGHRFIADLPKFPNSALYAIHIECSVPANLTDVRFAADGLDLVNLPVVMLNRAYLKANPGRTIQNAIRTASDGTTSGFVHLDFASRNFDDDAVMMDYEEHVLDLTYANAAPTIHNIIMEIASNQPSKLKK